MEPSKCKICGKKEWHHQCTGSVSDTQEPKTSKPARPEKKSSAFSRVEAELKATLPAAELLARVESLESRVLELESRKKYMRDYQRRRRAEENSNGNG